MEIWLEAFPVDYHLMAFASSVINLKNSTLTDNHDKFRYFIIQKEINSNRSFTSVIKWNFHFVEFFYQFSSNREL